MGTKKEKIRGKFLLKEKSKFKKKILRNVKKEINPVDDSLINELSISNFFFKRNESQICPSWNGLCVFSEGKWEDGSFV